MCKPSEQLFPDRQPLSNPDLTNNMKTYIRFKQNKNSTPKHKTNRTTTELSPWNDQQYELEAGGGAGPNFALIFCSGSVIYTNINKK